MKKSLSKKRLIKGIALIIVILSFFTAIWSFGRIMEWKGDEALLKKNFVENALSGVAYSKAEEIIRIVVNEGIVKAVESQDNTNVRFDLYYDYGTYNFTREGYHDDFEAYQFHFRFSSKEINEFRKSTPKSDLALEITLYVDQRFPYVDAFKAVFSNLQIPDYSRQQLYNISLAAFCFCLGVFSLFVLIRAEGTQVILSVLNSFADGCKGFVRRFVTAIGRIPFPWKGTALLLAFFAAEKLLLMDWLKQSPEVVWIQEKIILLIVSVYYLIVLYRLKVGGEQVAQGRENYRISTLGMFGECRKHGEVLNNIEENIRREVEARMKSEHMKTELIANVSHDIKTPLTSIINYTDLLIEENIEDEKVREYTQVLKRQSLRLKRLLENLVEMSRATSGNTEVFLEPCDAGVLLVQMIGEYEQRMQKEGLILVAKPTEEDISIMADGKLLWRVFDNLLDNILKYAQPGTRVYLTVERIQDKVEISFKNTSRYQLDISPQELMERFVRGDRSRHTEGNGLGLSIAESLTRLQGGEMLLTLDGDFFKVVLRFPLLEEKGEEAGQEEYALPGARVKRIEMGSDPGEV